MYVYVYVYAETSLFLLFIYIPASLNQACISYSLQSLDKVKDSILLFLLQKYQAEVEGCRERDAFAPITTCYSFSTPF